MKLPSFITILLRARSARCRAQLPAAPDTHTHPSDLARAFSHLWAPEAEALRNLTATERHIIRHLCYSFFRKGVRYSQQQSRETVERRAASQGESGLSL